MFVQEHMGSVVYGPQRTYQYPKSVHKGLMENPMYISGI
jgi:hypothetical protein